MNPLANCTRFLNVLTLFCRHGHVGAQMCNLLRHTTHSMLDATSASYAVFAGLRRSKEQTLRAASPAHWDTNQWVDVSSDQTIGHRPLGRWCKSGQGSSGFVVRQNWWAERPCNFTVLSQVIISYQWIWMYLDCLAKLSKLSLCQLLVKRKYLRLQYQTWIAST